MAKIMVVDDMAVFREPIAASLELAGYAVCCAADGKEALRKLKAEKPDLMLLDLAMPEMDGLSLLKAMRASADTAKLAVIILTASTNKDHVLEAAKLGVQEYLLKSRFSLKELLGRVAKCLPGSGPDSREKTAAEIQSDAKPKSASAPKAAEAAATAAATPIPQTTEKPPRLLDPEAFQARAQKAMQARTLSGVVGQVLSLTGSPRAELSELANLIGRDAMLSARVLQAANSAAYGSGRGAITSLSEAVRQIGCSTIRNIAASLGIYDAMPETTLDGFNPIRCWQHSFAVARLTEQLAAKLGEDVADIAYLVGLCHDLGEILLRTAFAEEYRQVLDWQQRTGRPRPELELEMLGMRHGEMVSTILRCLRLPDTILTPIQNFHDPSGSRGTENDKALTRVLLLADFYANGLLLASGGDATIAPFTQSQCRSGCGEENPARPDPSTFRCEVLSLAMMLARLSRQEEETLTAPLYPRHEGTRIWLARDPQLSGFDPISAALSLLAEVETRDRLPNRGELDGFDALVVVGQTSTTGGFTDWDLDKAIKSQSRPDTPVLRLAARADSSGVSGGRPVLRSISLDALSQFVSSAVVAERRSAA